MAELDIKEVPKIVSGENEEVILERVKQNVESWRNANLTLDMVKIRRLSGLSNACYKVEIKSGQEGE